MKKEYLEPQIEVITITEQQMLAFSGDVVEVDDPVVDPTLDDEEGTNLVRMIELEDDPFSL